MDWPIPGIADILYMTKNDLKWSPIMESVSQLYDSQFPSLAIDRNDIFHMTFQDGLSLLEGDVFYRCFNFFDMFWSNIGTGLPIFSGSMCLITTGIPESS
jgi:hypothetical protein